MRQRFYLFSVLFALLAGLPLRSWAAPPTRVSYVVAADTAHHLYHVTLKAEGVDGNSITFAVPAWSPGWYVLTHAYKNIENVAATGDANTAPLAVTHEGDLTWKVQTGGAKTITLTYDVEAVDQDPEALGLEAPKGGKTYGFFAPYLDDKNGLVPGPATLLYVVDGKDAPCRVTYQVPTGWQIVSANTPVPGDPTSFTAPNYDTLADQYADLGNFRRYDRTVGGVPMTVLIIGADGVDATRWVDHTFKIAEAGIKFWGRAPFPRYVFQYRFPVGGRGGGGLEHLNSTVITLAPESLTDGNGEDDALIAHEYFHAWNVKRIRPQTLGPFDYTQPVRIKDLWWLEGVTDYYAPRLVVAAGLSNPLFWRGYMSYQINVLQNNPARKTVTLETASLKAWEGESEGFGGLSYYNKGLLVGMLLDIEMRRRTANKVSLDDLMRTLFFETQSTGKGYPDGEIERLAGSLTKSDFKPFFDKCLRSTDELNYAGILAAAGLSLVDSGNVTPRIGLIIAPDPADTSVLRINSVDAGGPAEKAGLHTGDTVAAVGGVGVRSLTGSPLVGKKPGDSLTLTIHPASAPATIQTITVTLGEKENHAYRLVPAPHPTAQQAAILAAISGAKPVVAKSETKRFPRPGTKAVAARHRH